MSILQYASPTGEYSSYDRDIFEDYDNRIGTYNKALTDYKALAEPYQGLVDTHNTNIGAYNTQLDKYKLDAAAYNKAIEEFNAGPRTTEYAGPTSPGQFSGVMPIFQGGEAPVAPEDPGFSGADVDEFVAAAGERAQATADIQGTAQAVMTDPTQTYRTRAGDVNLGGMAGFGSESMAGLAGLAGFADGGIVQNFAGGGEAMESPYADPMKSNNMLPPTSPIFAPQVAQQQAEMQQPPTSGSYPAFISETPQIADLPAPDNQQADFNSQNLGGLGGLFGGLFSGGDSGGLQQATAAKPQVAQSARGLGGQGQMDQFQQMMQMRQGFDQQMGGMRGAPLENYKQYLNQTYTGPEMQEASAALSGALEGRVDEFVGMVDEAERAHFDAEESFGFGGGPMSGGQDQGMDIQRFAEMQRGQGQEDQMPMQGLGSAINNFQMFEDGGRVEARPPERGPTPDVYMEEGGQTAFAPASDEALTRTRQKVIKDYGFDPLQIAREEGVDPELYLRVMHQESKGDASAVSSAGARNLMQIMPATAADLGIKDLDDPLANARGGARYLLQQLNEFGTVPLALAAYNAGPGNVRKYKGVPPFDETRKYVSIIHGVSAGEILPNTNDFFRMNPDEDPMSKPPSRPEGLGTPDFEPLQRAASEYLMADQPQEAPMPEAPVMRPEVRQMNPEEAAQEGIGDAFYKQYAAYDYEKGPR